MRRTAYVGGVRWIGIAARFVVGGLWLVAGLIKIGNPVDNVRGVRTYELLPEGLVGPVGHTLPVLQIVLGVCLVLGFLTRPMAVTSVVVLVAFMVGIISAWARGLSIECGCFGIAAGPAPGAADDYPWELARDVGLLAAAGWLVWRPRTPYSVDEWLRRRVPLRQRGAVQ